MSKNIWTDIATVSFEEYNGALLDEYEAQLYFSACRNESGELRPHCTVLDVTRGLFMLCDKVLQKSKFKLTLYIFNSDKALYEFVEKEGDHRVRSVYYSMKING